MTDLLSLLHERFEGKYDYLRLGYVKVSVEEKNATVTFLVPEDVYDYSFKSEDVNLIKAAVKDAIGLGYTVYCRFEKIILSSESVKSELIEHMCKHFPMIAANIDFSKIEATIGEGIELHFVVPQNIRDYMNLVSFERKIADFFSDKHSIRTTFTFEICENDPEELLREKKVAVGRYGKSVEVTDKRLVVGKLSDLHASAVHISTLKGEGEDVVCCGTVSYLSFKTRDESKKGEYKRFFKHFYTFSISDTTGFLNVFLNTDVELPALQNGAEVVCKGRVNTREETNNLSMYAKSVALCKIPFSTISEQTKPLDPPENYSVITPQEYRELHYDQVAFDFGESALPGDLKLGAEGVAISVKSIKNERSYVPYEVAMCLIEKGKIVSYLHTYLKVAFSNGTEKEAFANLKGYASPRLSTVIPDLIKYSSGKLLIGVNPTGAMDLLNATAKPLRYLFRNDVHVVPKASLKLTKGGDADALEEAIAAAQAFIEE